MSVMCTLVCYIPMLRVLLTSCMYNRDSKRGKAEAKHTLTNSNTTSSESEVERERVRTLSSPGMYPPFDWNSLMQVTYKDYTIQVRLT